MVTYQLQAEIFLDSNIEKKKSCFLYSQQFEQGSGFYWPKVGHACIPEPNPEPKGKKWWLAQAWATYPLTYLGLGSSSRKPWELKRKTEEFLQRKPKSRKLNRFWEVKEND